VDHVLVDFGVAFGVGDVPAKRGEEGVDEFTADLGFVVAAGAIGVEIPAEAVDEVEDFLRRGHARTPA